MSDSTGKLDYIAESSSDKAAAVNQNANAAWPAEQYALKSRSGLTWNYYGARFNQTDIPNSFVTLVDNATNYIVASRTDGSVSVSQTTTNYLNTTGYRRLYKVTMASGVATFWDDRYDDQNGGGGGGGGGGIPVIGGQVHIPFDETIPADRCGHTVNVSGFIALDTNYARFDSASTRFFSGGHVVVVPASAGEFDIATNGTYEFWVYKTSFSGSQLIFDSRGPGTAGTGTIAMYVDGSGVLNIYGFPVSAVSTNAMSANKWTHVALTRSNSTGHCYLAFDGIITDLGTATMPTIASGGYVIGADNSGSTALNGNVCEHRVDTTSCRYSGSTGATYVLPPDPASGGGGGSPIVPALQFACSDETTALTTGTNVARIRNPYGSRTISGVRAWLKTASTSGAVSIDIKKNGTTILSTALSIDASEKTSTTAATPAVISVTSIADDDEISVDITGAGTGAYGLAVSILLT